MTLPTQTAKRLPTIKASLIEGLTITQIAKKCSVYEKTIDRDLRVFRQSGEFEAWLKEEWMRLHHIIIKQNPTEAYKQITRLIGQTITRRIEARTEIREIKLLWEIKDEHTHTKDTVFATQRAAKLSREQS